MTWRCLWLPPWSLCVPCGRHGPTSAWSQRQTRVKPPGVGFDAVLRVRLLGGLGVDLNGTVIDSPVSQRPWAVFAYVALAGRPVTRSELANRFWPDVLDQSARASLRSALWAIRRVLGDALSVDAERVALGQSWVDIAKLERLAAAAPEPALELCRGELLEGLEDDWAALARDRHRERVIGLLEEL